MTNKLNQQSKRQLWLPLGILFQFVITTHAYAQAPASNNKTIAPIVQIAKQYGAAIEDTQSLAFEFRATENRFGHYSKPWEITQRKLAGKFWNEGTGFYCRDTISRRTTSQLRETAYINNMLFRAVDDQPTSTTKTASQQYLRESCRYTPSLLLRHIVNSLSENHFEKNKISIKDNGNFYIVSGSIAEEDFTVHFNENSLIKIEWTRHHEMFGDQTISMKYANPKTVGSLTYPSSIVESSYGQTLFELRITSASRPESQPSPIKPPNDYQLRNEEATKELVEVDKFSERVTFLHMTHTDSRTAVVEFNDFLMVIDAPISSRNGQLILNKIQELKFGKPVKLFAFGHHHPHYLGGVRAFVAAEATVLTTKAVKPYLDQLVSFPHTKSPDQLQRIPKQLVVQEFEDQITISDGDYEVNIFDIGLKSHHTVDYLLFYFPEEKMVFQGDGVNLRAGSPPSRRTRSVYDAIKRLNLEVADCIQGWPTQNFGVKTKVEFSELESYIEEFDQAKSETQK